MTETAANVFRDYNTEGVPASGEYEPEKVLIRAWGKQLEDAVVPLTTLAALVDPNADRLLFWDDSAGAYAFLTLAPGLVLSEGVVANAEMRERLTAPVIARRAIKRDQMPGDLVGPLLFLASDDSAFMTGETVVVDGGSVMH